MTAPNAAAALAVAVLLSCGCGGERPVGSEPGASVVSRSGGEERGPASDGGGEVRFDMLGVEAGRVARSPGPLARNPFRFGASSPRRAMENPPPLDEPVDWRDPPPLDLLTWPDAAVGMWSNPPLVLIGVIEAPASAGRVAVLTDGEAVYHGRVGDVLGEYARIVSITPPSMELEAAAGGRYTLHMASP